MDHAIHPIMDDNPDRASKPHTRIKHLFLRMDHAFTRGKRKTRAQIA